MAHQQRRSGRQLKSSMLCGRLFPSSAQARSRHRRATAAPADAVTLLKGLYQHLWSHQGIDGHGEAHSGMLLEVQVELQKVLSLQAQINLQVQCSLGKQALCAFKRLVAYVLALTMTTASKRQTGLRS